MKRLAIPAMLGLMLMVAPTPAAACSFYRIRTDATIVMRDVNSARVIARIADPSQSSTARISVERIIYGRVAPTPLSLFRGNPPDPSGEIVTGGCDGPPIPWVDDGELVVAHLGIQGSGEQIVTNWTPLRDAVTVDELLVRYLAARNPSERRRIGRSMRGSPY